MVRGCKTCLRVIKDPAEGLYITSVISDASEVSLEEKLRDCIPELILEDTENVVLCHSCVANLTSAYKFKERCLETQQKIYGFFEQVPSNNEIDIGEIAMYYQRMETNTKVADSARADTLNKPQKMPYNCAHCQFACLDKCVLSYHEIIHKSSAPPHKCNQCSFIFPTTTLLLDHLATHTNEQPYACNVCDFVTAVHMNLKEHSADHRKLFQCTICWKRFAGRPELDLHMEGHTNEEDMRLYQCGWCNFKCDSVNMLQLHRNGSHQHVYKCKVCKVPCRTEFGLMQHMKWTHSQHIEVVEEVDVYETVNCINRGVIVSDTYRSSSGSRACNSNKVRSRNRRSKRSNRAGTAFDTYRSSGESHPSNSGEVRNRNHQCEGINRTDTVHLKCIACGYTARSRKLLKYHKKIKHLSVTKCQDISGTGSCSSNDVLLPNVAENLNARIQLITGELQNNLDSSQATCLNQNVNMTSNPKLHMFHTKDSIACMLNNPNVNKTNKFLFLQKNLKENMINVQTTRLDQHSNKVVDGHQNVVQESNPNRPELKENIDVDSHDKENIQIQVTITGKDMGIKHDLNQKDEISNEDLASPVRSDVHANNHASSAIEFRDNHNIEGCVSGENERQKLEGNDTTGVRANSASIKKIKGDTVRKVYQCPLCTETRTRYNTLRKHIKKAHSKPPGLELQISHSPNDQYMNISTSKANPATTMTSVCVQQNMDVATNDQPKNGIKCRACSLVCENDKIKTEHWWLVHSTFARQNLKSSGTSNSANMDKAGLDPSTQPLVDSVNTVSTVKFGASKDGVMKSYSSLDSNALQMPNANIDEPLDQNINDLNLDLHKPVSKACNDIVPITLHKIIDTVQATALEACASHPNVRIAEALHNLDSSHTNTWQNDENPATTALVVNEGNVNRALGIKRKHSYKATVAVKREKLDMQDDENVNTADVNEEFDMTAIAIKQENLNNDDVNLTISKVEIKDEHLEDATCHYECVNYTALAVKKELLETIEANDNERVQ